VEVGALLGLAWPLVRISAPRCLAVVERALRLSAGQNDPLLRARTRMRGLFLRVWAGGWNALDVDECAQAQHRRLSRSTMLQLAQSLGAEERLCTTFLSAPRVRTVLGDTESTLVSAAGP
jgi:hypothetical protein